MYRWYANNRIRAFLLALIVATVFVRAPFDGRFAQSGIVANAEGEEIKPGGEPGNPGGEGGEGGEGDVTPEVSPETTPETSPEPSPKLTDIPEPSPSVSPIPSPVQPSPSPEPPSPSPEPPSPSPSPSPSPEPTPSPTPTPEGTGGYINVASELNVRERYPNRVYETPAAVKDSSGYAIQLTPGTLVRVLEKKTIGTYNDGSTCTWFKIKFDYRGQTGLVGYVAGDYVSEYPDFDREEDEGYLAYRATLAEEGFPASYHEMLYIIHLQHPNWVFKAMKTGLDWNAALNEQYRIADRSLVNKSCPSSWKSTDGSNYLWMDANGNDGGYTRYDGGNWNAASKELIAYCMDPRNFLGEKALFMFEKQSYDKDLQTLEGVKSMLVGSHMAGDIPGEGTSYASVLIEAAEISGVSPYMLAARIFQEVGRAPENTSSIISGKSGYYNYYNFGSTGTKPVEAGLNFAKKEAQSFTINGKEVSDQRPWNTRRKAIIGGAVRLGADYVARGQDTLYLQKFNVTSYNTYSHQYMTNVTAPYQETDLYFSNMNVKENPAILQVPYVFSIPVYSGMPETKSSRPVGDGNPNGYLKSLSIEGEDMTPAFDYKTLAYDLVVGPGTASVNISASPIASTTTVSGAGKVNLAYGDNTINIDCRAGNGKVTRYVIHIFRKETTETIVAQNYDLTDQRILGVSPGTDVASFLQQIVVTGSSKTTVIDVNGAELSSSALVGTGCCLKTDDFKIPIVIYGEVTGDGQITAQDLLYIKRHILSVAPLSGAALQAADVKNGDGISALDLLYVKRHILGLETIVQPKK